MKIKLNKHWISNQSIAHRGLHSCNGEIPENSIVAFQKAIEKEYTIELDVQLSKDNEIVVFHDYDLERMCNNNSKVSELYVKELKELNLMGSNEKIPTFNQVLKLVSDRVPILIEIKNESSSTLLESKLNEVVNKYTGRYAIQSFNPKSLNWFYKNNPKILRGQLSSGFNDVKMNFFVKYLLKNLFLNNLSHPHFIAYNIDDLPKKRIQRIRKKIPVLGWTIDTNIKLKKSLLHCDNVIFECVKNTEL